MSKPLADILFPLIGTIIVGLIAYFSTTAIETRKWKRERETKYRQQSRQALIRVLDWIAPVDDAFTNATVTVMMFKQGEMTGEDFHRSIVKVFPKPGDLHRLPEHYQALLDKDIYEEGYSVFLDLFFAVTPPSDNKDIDIEAFTKEMEGIQEKFNHWRDRVHDAYRATFH
jgi:hypothetical protein